MCGRSFCFSDFRSLCGASRCIYFSINCGVKLGLRWLRLPRNMKRRDGGVSPSPSPKHMCILCFLFSVSSFGVGQGCFQPVFGLETAVSNLPFPLWVGIGRFQPGFGLEAAVSNLLATFLNNNPFKHETRSAHRAPNEQRISASGSQRLAASF